MGKAAFLFTAIAFALLLLALGGWLVQAVRRPAAETARF
jgi:hypothetical protein